MPLRWLEAYQEQYTALQAEEALLAAAVAMAADSNVDKRQRQKLLDGWQRAAQGAPVKAPVKRQAMTPEEYRGMMASLGMVSGNG